MSTELVSPSLVPVGLLIRIAKAGLDTTDKVHAAITKGELQKHKGIGPYTEQRTPLLHAEGA